MPELPEVETIRKDLARKIRNKKITSLTINKKGVIKEPSPANFKKALIGKTVKDVIRRAKVLIIKLSGGKFLIIHLRIAGWLLYGKQDSRARVVFKFSGGGVLNYMDQRLLGELRVRNDYQNLKFIKNLGPEPNEITGFKFFQNLQKRKAKIKALLLNQNFIAGLGNIYAQEALFLAKIGPQRPAKSLSELEAKRLHRKIVSVLAEAIAHKGSSIDLYRVLDGKKGGMEKRLKVYGRQGLSCFVCKGKIEKVSLAGRGTCFCPRCQR